MTTFLPSSREHHSNHQTTTMKYVPIHTAIITLTFQTLFFKLCESQKIKAYFINFCSIDLHIIKTWKIPTSYFLSVANEIHCFFRAITFHYIYSMEPLFISVIIICVKTIKENMFRFNYLFSSNKYKAYFSIKILSNISFFYCNCCIISTRIRVFLHPSHDWYIDVEFSWSWWVGRQWKELGCFENQNEHVMFITEILLEISYLLIQTYVVLFRPNLTKIIRQPPISCQWQ